MTLTLTPPNLTETSAAATPVGPEPTPVRREPWPSVSNPAPTPLRNPSAILNRAMHQADDYVVSLEYLDSKGQRTRRVMSPIRFVGKNRVLGLCLGRCEPRQFYLDRCQNITLHHANQFVMPVPIEVLTN